MTSPERGSPSGPTESTIPRSLRETLRLRQLARSRKSCLPCRERKVRCDKELPCSTCKKRDHPDLCAYENDILGGSGSPRRQQSLEHTARFARRSSGALNFHPPERTSQTQHGSVFPSVTQGSSAGSQPTPPQGSSVLDLGRRTGNHPIEDVERQTAFETGVLPLLGIDGDDFRASDGTSATLKPEMAASNRDIIGLFEAYRTRVHPFHHITYDLGVLEERLCLYLRSITVGEKDLPEDRGFLCLLYATLASGAQFCDLPTERRLSLCKTYSKSPAVLDCPCMSLGALTGPATYAFDMLRAIDYLARPSKEALQTLLLLGNVLQNDMKPQAAWALGGTTIRLAQCLGIHRRVSPPRPLQSAVPPVEAQNLRYVITAPSALKTPVRVVCSEFLISL